MKWKKKKKIYGQTRHHWNYSGTLDLINLYRNFVSSGKKLSLRSIYEHPIRVLRMC